MSKKLVSMLLIVMMSIMVLSGCSSKTDSDSNSSAENSNECVAEAARSAYMNILEDNADAIDKYDWQMDYGQNSMVNNVAIEDINNDDVLELFFMTTDGTGYAEMHIYIYTDIILRQRLPRNANTHITMHHQCRILPICLMLMWHLVQAT